MKKNEVTIGSTYLAKVSDRLVAVRIDRENPHGGWDATNMTTNKKVRIKSAQRLRVPVSGGAPGSRAPDSGGAPGPPADSAALAATPGTPGAPGAPANTLDSMPARNRRQRGPSGGQRRAKATDNGERSQMSGLDAAAKVLKDAGTPLRCKDLIEAMLTKGLWKTGGKTPVGTIHAAMVREIKTKGDTSRFQKTGRGLFALNNN